MVTKTYTTEEFYEFVQQHPRKRFERIDGEIIEVSPANPIPPEIGMLVGSMLVVHCLAHKLGRVTGAEGGYNLLDGATVAPDVGFVSAGRPPFLEAGYYDGAPDLAVEVLSSSDRVSDAYDKMRSYIAAGAHFVGMVHPEREAVETVEPGDDDAIILRHCTIGTTLSGEDVVPGFELPVANIFLEDNNA